MSRWVAVAVLVAVATGSAGCLGGTVCDEVRGHIVMDIDAPSSEPALFFVAELYVDGQEVAELDPAQVECTTFPIHDGKQHTVRATYWLAESDCWFQADTDFGVLDDDLFVSGSMPSKAYTRDCEDV